MNPTSIFDSLPRDLNLEVFEELVHASTVRIERIVSKGQTTPEVGWYDQEENEWVMVVKGKACLEFEDGSICDLSAGDYINISAHVKHKVLWTDPNHMTIWLAVFYS
jgi:cupin 2 domain-containing protein